MLTHLSRSFAFGLCYLLLPMVATAAESEARPWPPQYKIKPHETDKLTAADVVGPDGIVYPDWRHAGIPGGIPDVPVVARLADYEGRPDDEKDDSAALVTGAVAVARAGGGALLLEPARAERLHVGRLPPL